MTIHVVQSEDGFQRRAFSVDDVRRMVEAGIMDPKEPVELREGELIAVPAEKFTHGRALATLARLLHRALPDEWFVGTETTLQLGPATLVEPDAVICPGTAVHRSDEDFLTVSGADLFLIEVADTSLRRDRTYKAQLYARHGVQEYWIVDLNERRILVHRRPERGVYQAVTTVEDDEPAIPEPPGPSFFRLRIAELD